MHKLTIILLINCLSFLAYANDPNEKQQALIAKFLTQQTNQHISVKKRVLVLFCIVIRNE